MPISYSNWMYTHYLNQLQLIIFTIYFPDFRYAASQYYMANGTNPPPPGAPNATGPAGPLPSGANPSVMAKPMGMPITGAPQNMSSFSVERLLSKPPSLHPSLQHLYHLQQQSLMQTASSSSSSPSSAAAAAAANHLSHLSHLTNLCGSAGGSGSSNHIHGGGGSPCIPNTTVIPGGPGSISPASSVLGLTSQSHPSPTSSVSGRSSSTTSPCPIINSPGNSSSSTSSASLLRPPSSIIINSNRCSPSANNSSNGTGNIVLGSNLRGNLVNSQAAAAAAAAAAAMTHARSFDPYTKIHSSNNNMDSD